MMHFLWSTAASGYTVKRGRLVAKSSSRARPVKPSDIDAEDIILEFAQLDGSSNSVCDFANRFGLLTARPLEGEPLARWRKEIKSVREVIEYKRDGRFIEAAETFSKGNGRQGGVRVIFGPNATGTDLELGFNPSDLISWIWLQVGQNITGREVKTCKECGKFFMAGGGKGGRARQSRKTQVYCSDDCRMTFNNRRLTERKKSERKERKNVSTKKNVD
jgi:hypothetical protein